MTATPHNGREEDFQLFIALPDGDRFQQPPALQATSGCDGSVTIITPLTTMGNIRASTKRSLVILASPSTVRAAANLGRLRFDGHHRRRVGD